MNLLETTQPISNPIPQSEDPFDMLNDDLLSMNLQDAPLPSIIPIQETPSPFGSKTLEPFKVFIEFTLLYLWLFLLITDGNSSIWGQMGNPPSQQDLFNFHHKNQNSWSV